MKLRFRDHPRVCGKDGKLADEVYRQKGSPPRVREGRVLGGFAPSARRITPACAGRTGIELNLCHDFQDHPRVCGKDRKDSTVKICRSGSPPRVREGLDLSLKSATLTGITPACAGRTFNQELPAGGVQDHPRVCGKDLESEEIDAAREGSPPRVREGPRQPFVRLGDFGITPACAGRTFLTFSATSHSGDHPRVCGKDCSVRIHMNYQSGSPPRVREGLSTKYRSSVARRITPACAGRTLFCRFRIVNK